MSLDQGYRPAGPSGLAIHPLSKLRGILADRVKASRAALELPGQPERGGGVVGTTGGDDFTAANTQ
ncbi:MAG: hypothetical protein PVF54_02810 [Anaerolineae bacterium]